MRDTYGCGQSPPGVAAGSAAQPAAGSNMPMLETHDLTIRFGGHVAVDHVSCALRAGTLTAIVGPNGAGKTTYFNLISGQLPASEGRVSARTARTSPSLPAPSARGAAWAAPSS